MSKLDSPVWRQERARKARAAQSTPEYHLIRLTDNDPQAVAQSARALDPERLEKVRALLPALAEAAAEVELLPEPASSVEAA